ncbi:MAG: DNA polymerase III subunit gamma/tau [Bacteroidales bacterium]|nr:DNA polymerase III subunit gamma/tau [Bacteroidales bacterium]
MDTFIVSARKYRPSSFRSVVGQQHITDTLKNAILNNQLAQAFLFCGPRGVGKTTCARILAETINCTNLTPEGEACHECASCKSFDSGTSMNIFELDAASNNGVDDIRKLVDEMRVPPASGKYKVYIIDEVHMLSLQAFNALLKTLEEPPSFVKFILATTERHKVIPTILSRCQVFDFRRIELRDIAEHLAYVAKSENIQAEPEALEVIAQHADGGLRDALSTFDQMANFTGGNITYDKILKALNLLDSEYYFRIVDNIRNANLAQTLLCFEEVMRNGFDGQNFITGLTKHIRNLLVSLDTATLQLLEVGEARRKRYSEQAASCGMQLLIRYLTIASDYEYRYRDASNKRLFVEVALTKLAAQTMQPAAQQPAAATAPQAAAPQAKQQAAPPAPTGNASAPGQQPPAAQSHRLS